MKLVRFSSNGQTPRLGALQGDRIVDLTASVAATAEAVASIKEAVTIPAASARLHAPISDPAKFICIGLNYRDHALEAGQPIPKEPPIFAKWSPSIVGPGDPILRPRGSSQLDWEVELGVVIGRTARYVSREAALDYVWGYTIVNDVSARDFQFITTQWGAGKIADTFAPVGPYIADRGEIRDPHSLELKTFVNDRQMQKGNTKTFIFNVNYIVSYLSGIMTLAPGDLIATGTPPGVGVGMKPPVWLQPGDVVRMEITGLDTIEN